MTALTLALVPFQEGRSLGHGGRKETSFLGRVWLLVALSHLILLFLSSSTESSFHQGGPVSCRRLAPTAAPAGLRVAWCQ